MVSKMTVPFSVYDLHEFRCDNCNKFLCYGYISCHSESGFVCQECRYEQWEEDAKKRIEYLEGTIKEKQAQLACQDSKEGHDWEDISAITMSWGAMTFECTKCGLIKREGFDAAIINFGMPYPSNTSNFDLTLSSSNDNTEYKPWTGKKDGSGWCFDE